MLRSLGGTAGIGVTGIPQVVDLLMPSLGTR